MRLGIWKRHVVFGAIAGGIFLLLVGLANGLSLYLGSAKYFRGIAPGGVLPPEAKLELARMTPVILLAYLYNTAFGLALGALWGACVGAVQALRGRAGPPARFARPGVSPRGAMLAFHLAAFSTSLFLGVLLLALFLKGYLMKRPEAGELARWAAGLAITYGILVWGLGTVLTPVLRPLARLRALRPLGNRWLVTVLLWLLLLPSALKQAHVSRAIVFLLCGVAALVLVHGLYGPSASVCLRLARVRALRALARPRIGLAILGAVTIALLLVALVPALIARSGAATRNAAGSEARVPPTTARPPGSGQPNVLLLVLDTTRADHLSAYGYGHPTTPNLDRLAGDGVLYENAYSPGVWTFAGHAAIFSGLFPSRSGADGEHLYLDPGVTTLAEALAAAGYRTQGFCNNAWVSDWTGLSQGFEELRQVWTKRYNTQFILAPMALQFVEFAATGNLPVGGVIRTNEQVLHWLDGLPRDGRPFFCFVNYMEAHPPLEYRPAFTDPFRPPDLPVSEVARVNQNPYAVWARKDLVTPEEARAYAVLYDGEIHYLDTHVQTLFDGLRERGLLDDTVVVVTADHGEAIGEHGDLGHHLHLWEGVLRVPLIVHYPRAFPAGSRVVEPVQTVDIFPTILALAGAEDPAVVSRLQGRALPPLAPADPSRLVIAEEMRPVLELGFIRAMGANFDVEKEYGRHHRAVISGGWKYVWSSDGRHEIYDLTSDPGENVDLRATRPDRARELDEAMHAWLSTFTPYDTAGVGYSFRPPDKQTLDQLKTLGYVQ